MKLKITNYLLELLNRERKNFYASLFESLWELNTNEFDSIHKCNYEYVNYSLQINNSKAKIHALKSKLKMVNETIDCIKNG